MGLIASTTLMMYVIHTPSKIIHAAPIRFPKSGDGLAKAFVTIAFAMTKDTYMFYKNHIRALNWDDCDDSEINIKFKRGYTPQEYLDNGYTLIQH